MEAFHLFQMTFYVHSSNEHPVFINSYVNAHARSLLTGNGSNTSLVPDNRNPKVKTETRRLSTCIMVMCGNMDTRGDSYRSSLHATCRPCPGSMDTRGDSYRSCLHATCRPRPVFYKQMMGTWAVNQLPFLFKSHETCTKNHVPKHL